MPRASDHSGQFARSVFDDGDDAMKNAEFSAAVIEALVASARAERKKIRPGDAVAGTDYYFARCIGKSDQASIDWLKRFQVKTWYPRIVDVVNVPRRELSRGQRRASDEGIEIKRSRLTPLLPRYLMVQLDHVEQWSEIFKVAGLVGMAFCEGVPVRVPEFEVKRMQSLEREGGIPAEISIRQVFAIGEHVRVVDGPFASFPGEIEEIANTKLGELDPLARIKVAVNIFGRATPVELERWQVEKI